MWRPSEFALLGYYNSSLNRAFNKLGEMDASMLLFAVRYPIIFHPLIIIGGELVYSLKGAYELYSLPNVAYSFQIEPELYSLPYVPYSLNIESPV